MFASRGFEGTSICDIAAASGVLSGSLYYHFPSKEDLLFTVHQESLTAMRREVEAAIVDLSDPWQRLEEAIVAHCKVLLGGSVTRRHPDAAALLLLQAARRQEAGSPAR